jgi:hypothetical protein
MSHIRERGEQSADKGGQQSSLHDVNLSRDRSEESDHE